MKEVFIKCYNTYRYKVEFQNKPLPFLMGSNIIFKNIYVEVGQK